VIPADMNDDTNHRMHDDINDEMNDETERSTS
jgi:hypothetical protein